MTSPLNVPIPSIQQATQAAARLLQQELALAQQTADPAQLTSLDVDLARSNLKALAFVQGIGLHGAYRYVRDFLARQAIPIYSVGAFLDGWLATFKLTRKAASSSTGPVGGTGVPGATLPAGTLLQTALGQQFKVQADVVVSGGGTFTAALIATVPGAGALVTNTTALTLVSAVAGIDSATTASADFVPGTDTEKDDEAVYRLQQRLSFQPMGGAPSDYARWALEVPGITRAWGVRNPAGPTSAGVIIMADGNAPYGLPTTGQRDQVYSYIADPTRGPPDELFAIIPTAEPLNPTLSISPDTPAMRSAVVAALQDLYFRESVPGGTLPHGHLIQAVSEVVGEYNHSWTSPAITQGAFLTASTFSSLLVLGVVAFA